jgi:hypothetical protein
MQQKQQHNARQQNNERNPEVTVRKNGFEHNLS